MIDGLAAANVGKRSYFHPDKGQNMSYPFIDRNPTPNENEQIRLAMSSFCDGSGFLLEPDGTSRPASRDFERIFAELFGGSFRYDKGFFDLYIEINKNTHAGISVKSKQIDRQTAIEDLKSGGRVHIELSNSPSRNREALKNAGFSESDFKNKAHPQEIGTALINFFNTFPSKAQEEYSRSHPGIQLDLSKSYFINVSYSKQTSQRPRKYQIHTFPLELPTKVTWEYKSEKSMQGYEGGDKIYEWYPFSGGQFKYYPSTSTAKFNSTQFYLEKPRQVSIIEKTSRYWPREWIDSEGSQNIQLNIFIEELQRQKLIIEDKDAKSKIESVLSRLRELI